MLLDREKERKESRMTSELPTGAVVLTVVLINMG